MSPDRSGPVASDLDLGRLAGRVLGLLAPADGVAIVVEDSGLLTTVGAAGDSAGHVGRGAEVGDTLTARALRHGGSIVCDDVDDDPRVEAGTRADPRMRAMLGTPLAAEEDRFGLLVAVSRRPCAFTPDLCTRAERIAIGLGLVLDRAVITGPTTGRNWPHGASVRGA